MMFILSVAGITSLLSVGVHYEALRMTLVGLDRVRVLPRLHVAMAILAALVAHLVESMIFAASWYFVDHVGVGYLRGGHSFEDMLYFSLITYTSLGYGDIVPLGDARLLAGVESLVGLVMIGWTASFTYLEMNRYWAEFRRRPRAARKRKAAD